MERDPMQAPCADTARDAVAASPSGRKEVVPSPFASTSALTAPPAAASPGAPSSRAVDAALAELQAILGFFEAQMRVKGHERATAQLHVSSGTMEIALRTYRHPGAGDGEAAFVRSYGKMDFVYIDGTAIEDLLGAARQQIAQMDESVSRALAPWFEGPAP